MSDPSPPPAAVFRAGDPVALVDATGAVVLVTAGEPDAVPERVAGLGVFNRARLTGLAWGARVDHGAAAYAAVPPAMSDYHAALPRKAQVVLPKDAARIIHECDIRAGARVIESGIGSAHLTVALGRAVGPTGHVTTYEIRDDFLKWGRRNVELAGLADVVEAKLGDVTEGVTETDVDAVVLDIPTPWLAVAHARDALRGGGFLTCYTPTVSQVEETHRAIRESEGFSKPWTVELMERRWVVGERGSRPDFDMLGHTAFLTFARRVL